jgi:hypothetical protein
MDEPKKKAAPKKKVFKKNYFLKGIGAVGAGTEVTAEHRKHKDFSDKLTK